MGIEPHHSRSAEAQQKLSGIQFVSMSANPSSWKLQDIINGNHYAPRAIEIPCANIGRYYSPNKRAVTDIMGGVRFKEARCGFRQHDGNLSHKGCADIKDIYLRMSQHFFSVDQANLNLSIIAPTGTIALWAAVAVAHKYDSLKGGSRKGIVCSEGAHQWANEIGNLTGEYDLTYKVPLSGFNSEMSTALLLEKIEKHNPAALVLAAARTDDGCPESIDSVIEQFCLDHDLPIIIDASASAPFSFYSKQPTAQDPEASVLREKNIALLRSPAVKFVVNGWGKFIGPHSLSNVFLVHSDENATLCEAAGKIFHVPVRTNGCEDVLNIGLTENYFEVDKGHFAGWTQSDSNAEETCATITMLGPRYLSELVRRARSRAIELHNRLTDLGIKCEPVNTPLVVVPLKDSNAALKMQDELWKLHRIDVALTRGCGPGIRVVFNAGVEHTNDDIETLLRGIYSQYPGDKKQEAHFNVRMDRGQPSTMLVLDKHLLRNQEAYCGDPDENFYFEKQSKRDKVNSATRILHIIQATHGIETSLFRSAINNLAEYVLGDRNKKRKAIALEALNFFHENKTEIEQNKKLLNDLQLLASEYKLFALSLSVRYEGEKKTNHKKNLWSLINKTIKFGHPHEDKLIENDQLIPVFFDTDSLSIIERDPLFQNDF